MVVAPGESEIVVPETNSGAQMYVLAPDAVIDVLLPTQTVDGVALIVIVGNGFTVTVTVAESTHPSVDVPVTVYVVVEAGEASGLFIVDDDNPAAGDHEYVLAPDAITLTGAPPAHSSGAAGENVITGNGLTVAVTSVDVLLIPLTVHVTTHT